MRVSSAPRFIRDLPIRFGAWRSLVAHLHGVQGVASSNLAAPTNFIILRAVSASLDH